MSKTTFSASKSLCYVRPDSVPMCLRHGIETSAVYDAQNLAAFLQAATESILKDDSNFNGDSVVMGLDLCFDLLRDKLTIASGELPFPLTCDDAKAVLWNPEQGGDE